MHAWEEKLSMLNKILIDQAELADKAAMARFLASISRGAELGSMLAAELLDVEKARTKVRESERKKGQSSPEPSAKGTSAEKVAKAVGVSRASVNRAKKIKRGAVPEQLLMHRFDEQTGVYYFVIRDGTTIRCFTVVGLTFDEALAIADECKEIANWNFTNFQKAVERALEIVLERIN
jgi:hypothetical protein